MHLQCYNIIVPAPTVNVRSNEPNPIRPVGSDVILTCVVELSPIVGVSVTVNIQLTIIQLGFHGVPQLRQCLAPPIPLHLWSDHLGEVNLDSTHVELLSVQHFRTPSSFLE